MEDSIIIFNAGSSSIKFALFSINKLSLKFRGEVDGITVKPHLVIQDAEQNIVFDRTGLKNGYDNALREILKWCGKNAGTIKAAGHRVVHGGCEFTKPVKITPAIIKKLQALIPLAPLHQPYNIAAIEALAELHANLPQVACFDTAFHRTQPELSQIFAIPEKYSAEGIIRYGFHGLSYEYIASVLQKIAGKQARACVAVAHLGNGASICAMKNLKSVATTMGFTPLDGLMMGTRCGAIDPGVILYLLEQKKMPLHEVSELLYKKSGLKGIAGIGPDIRDILSSKTPEAKLAIDLFCMQAARQLAGTIPAMGGLDIIVFTAGIGTYSPVIREKICSHLKWLGITLNKTANLKNNNEISSKQSKIKIYVIPTNEEKIIAKKAMELI